MYLLHSPSLKAVQSTQLLLTQGSCCLGKEGRSFLTSSKQPPTTCSQCSGTKLCYLDRAAFMLVYLDRYPHPGKKHLAEKHSGCNSAVLCWSRFVNVMVWEKIFLSFWTGSICIVVCPHRTCAVLLSLPQTCSLDTKSKSIRSLCRSQSAGRGPSVHGMRYPIVQCHFILPLNLQVYYSLA